jgi:tetratricopeptide (TPR) repeat protein
MVTAPVVVFLYDRTFLAGSFRQAWRRRRWLYAGLTATWLPLATLAIGAHGRGASAGPGAGVTVWEYALTQCMAVTQYLRLSLWPAGLCLDYGVPVARTAGEVLPGAVLLAILASATLWALVRRPRLGFVGAYFLAVLAPTSSFVPIATQTIAEHRMYLALAAVIAGVVMFGGLLLSGALRLLRLPARRRVALHAMAAAALTLSLSVALGARTRLRNGSYRTDLSLWEEIVRQGPSNARAQKGLGIALFEHGALDDAISRLQLALALGAADAGTHSNLGLALARCGRLDEAVAHYRKALEISPGFAEVEYNLGNVWLRRGRIDEAIAHYQRAVEAKPDSAEAHYNLGFALAALGEADGAVLHYRKALAVRPDFAEAQNNLGVALMSRGQLDDAVAAYRKALEIRPDNADARRNLDAALSGRETLARRVAEARASLRSRPNDAALLNDTAWMLATSVDASARNGGDAVRFAERALRLRGGRDPAVVDTLAAAYAEAGRLPEAIAAAERAARLAAEAGDRALTEKIRARLGFYKTGRPYREPPRR